MNIVYLFTTIIELSVNHKANIFDNNQNISVECDIDCVLMNLLNNSMKIPRFVMSTLHMFTLKYDIDWSIDWNGRIRGIQNRAGKKVEGGKKYDVRMMMMMMMFPDAAQLFDSMIESYFYGMLIFLWQY